MCMFAYHADEHIRAKYNDSQILYWFEQGLWYDYVPQIVIDTLKKYSEPEQELMILEAAKLYKDNNVQNNPNP